MSAQIHAFTSHDNAMDGATRAATRRKDDRIILHYDYDCFYASVFENENPALKALPLAVQQKNIIVTCNYEARRRGLYKLMLIESAKRMCPDVVIVLGEQLDRFRDASKELYKYLEAFTWNKKVERLGFDEVFMDVSDIITYNHALLNMHDLQNSFFQLSRDDPTFGFPFDATRIAGHQYPDVPEGKSAPRIGESHLATRLMLGSHLAQYLRHKLEEDKNYTSTVGISTSKLLAKLVGNLHKPKGQTTLMPPYEDNFSPVSNKTQTTEEDTNPINPGPENNVTSFIDSHDIGKIPGIGFKMSHKIRSHVLSRPAEFDDGLMYGVTKESVTVGDVRRFPGMGSELLEKLLGGPGAEKGIGAKAWGLINGVDNTEVRPVKKVPSQISIEDSYIRLDTLPQVYKELRMLSSSLLKRMHMDLLEDYDDDHSHPPPLETSTSNGSISGLSKRWIAHPKTVRLTTRPRLALNLDGTRTRSFNRISRSGPLPNFVFDLREGLDAIVEKLVQETLIPMFHRLHPEKQGWNLSLMNVGVSNMAETASEDGSGGGRDIGRMFKRQEEVLKGWKVEDKDVPPDHIKGLGLQTENAEELNEGLEAEPSAGDEATPGGSKEVPDSAQSFVVDDAQWDGDDDDDMDSARCDICGGIMPSFAMAAHERYHTLGGE